MKKVLLWILYCMVGIVICGLIIINDKINQIQADQKMIIEVIDASHIMDSLNIY